MVKKIRIFKSGATRDTEENKIDYEGFLNPLVIKRFGEYMSKHRVQKNGLLRDSDNWQKGMPLDSYIKSDWRHFMDVWLHHRKNSKLARDDIEDALCGVLFNTMGYLYEILKNGKKNIQKFK